MDVREFVLSQLPRSPARILEVGCGEGDLARALAAASYAVTAIDPDAPAGALFRRVSLEEFGEPGPFDAVVAGRSLHHIHDLAGALDKIAGLLRAGGLLVLSEFAKERFDHATAEWHYGRLRALAAAGGTSAPGSLDECLREWSEDHADIHSYATMRSELDARFVERFVAWAPYLYRYLEGASAEALERALIEEGAIQATGFLYVGEYVPP